MWLWYDGRLNRQEPLSCCKHVTVQDQKRVRSHIRTHAYAPTCSHEHCEDPKNREALGAGNGGEWNILTAPLCGSAGDVGTRGGDRGFNIHTGTLNCAESRK